MVDSAATAASKADPCGTFSSSDLVNGITVPISESYCAPTPASNLRSASGIPMRSKVSLMQAGTLSQVRFWLSTGLA